MRNDVRKIVGEGEVFHTGHCAGKITKKFVRKNVRKNMRKNVRKIVRKNVFKFDIHYALPHEVHYDL